MVKDKGKKSEETIVDVAETYSKLENFANENKKKITIVVVVLAVIAGGWWWYRNYVVQPKIIKSQKAAFNATFDWENDSLTTAMEGTMEYAGLKNIYDNFQGTDEGELANYRLGIAFLNQGEFQKAIDHLTFCYFGDVVVGPLAHGCIGDCLMELGKTGEAVVYYEEAAKMADNDFITPYFLKKAGLGHMALNRYADALVHFKTIKEKYPFSLEGREIDKFIAYAENLSE